MASYNRVVIVGNLTRDPEVRYLPSGQAVCDLAVAVNERVKSGNEWVDQPTYLDVTLWERQAETAGQYLRKGNPVLIEGRLRQDNWTDKNTGEKRSKIKITGDRMVLLGGRPEGASRGGGHSGEGAPPSRGGYGGDAGAPPPRATSPSRSAPPPPPPADDPVGDDDNLPF
jgi:single-strand DNA-binding protein